MFVDALTMQMVKNPRGWTSSSPTTCSATSSRTSGAALQGGLGVAASANLHPGQTSMFEPVHGSAPKYAGTGRANPVGAILSATLMLDYLGHAEAAKVDRRRGRPLDARGADHAGPRRLAHHLAGGGSAGAGGVAGAVAAR